MYHAVVHLAALRFERNVRKVQLSFSLIAPGEVGAGDVNLQSSFRGRSINRRHVYTMTLVHLTAVSDASDLSTIVSRSGWSSSSRKPWMRRSALPKDASAANPIGIMIVIGRRAWKIEMVTNASSAESSSWMSVYVTSAAQAAKGGEARPTCMLNAWTCRYLLRGICMQNLDPESGANCDVYYAYIFPGVGTCSPTCTRSRAARRSSLPNPTFSIQNRTFLGQNPNIFRTKSEHPNRKSRCFTGGRFLPGVKLHRLDSLNQLPEALQNPCFSVQNPSFLA